MDPEVRKYFIKILNSISWGMIWILSMVMAGLYYRLAFVEDGFRWTHAIFYLVFAGTLLLLLRYYYRAWSK